MENKLDFLQGKTSYLVKFIKEEYIKDFLEGKIYMNTLKYFIDLEKETKIKGMGDRYEASAVLRDVEFKMFDSETNELVATGTTKEVSFYENDRVNTPVFCMFSVDSDTLKIKEETDEYISVTPFINEIEKQKLIDDFGDTLLAINPKPFLDRVRKACEEKDLGLIYSKVQYYDFSKNTTDRIEKYADIGNSNVCFIKDDELKYQNEFRFILNNVYTDTPYILDIGDISDIVNQIKISDFFSDKLELRYNKIKVQDA